ncbi:MAG: GH25 family lysozyme [Pseudomonadota bacterium]
MNDKSVKKDRGIRDAVTTLLPIALLSLFWSIAAYGEGFGQDSTCQSGPAKGLSFPSERASLCRTFFANSTNGNAIDTKVAKYIYFDGNPVGKTRSFALVVAVGKSPDASSGNDIDSAEMDFQHLINFLVNDEGFDLVVGLKDQDATGDNINYLLRNFFYHQLNKLNTRSRFLFAFSGHGVPGPNEDSQNSLILWGGTGDPDDPNTLSTKDLDDDLRNIKEKAWQTLVLINSCFSGGYFKELTGDHGGSPAGFSQSGAWAMTSTDAGDLSYADPLVTNGGSIFFDSLIDAVRSPHNGGVPPGNSRPDIVRFAGVLDSISDYIWNINLEKSQVKKLHEPWIGPILNHGSSGGALFFTVPPASAANGATGLSPPTTIQLPNGVVIGFPPNTTGDISKGLGLDIDNWCGAVGCAVAYHRTIAAVLPKTLAPPPTLVEKYGVHGLDFSAFNSTIDLKFLAASGRVQFAYVKATQGANKLDAKVRENLLSAAQSGRVNPKFKYGIYHVFMPCDDAQAQFDNLKAVYNKNDFPLPVAIDTEFVYYATVGPSRYVLGSCAKPPSVAEIRERLKQFVQLIMADSGRKPILYAPASAISGSELFDADLRSLPLWVADYTPSSIQTGRPHADQWTFWQYGEGSLGTHTSGREQVDLNVFNGSEDQFQALIAHQ